MIGHFHLMINSQFYKQFILIGQIFCLTADSTAPARSENMCDCPCLSSDEGDQRMLGRQRSEAPEKGWKHRGTSPGEMKGYLFDFVSLKKQ